jgi:hypothetical protein
MADPWEVDWKAQAPASAATTAEQPWNVDWKTPRAPSLAHEAAAIAVSPIKGVAGLAGFPGDVAELAAGAAHRLGEKLPDIPSPDEDSMMGRFVKFMKEESARSAKTAIGSVGSGDLPGSYVPPTSAQLKGSIEGVTGKLPDAESTPGKFLSTIGEFAPAAVLTGGESLVPNLVKGAVLPGAGSEALGSKFEGTWAEPYARLLGAIGGGITGAAGSKGAEVMANRSAAATAAKSASGDVAPAALAKVAKNFEADQLTPEAVTARQAELGPESMMLDMGRQLQGRAEAIASQPGKGQNKVLDAVEGRTGTFGSGTAQRVGDTLDQVMGPSQDVVALRNNAVGDIGGMLHQTLGPSLDIVATRNGINAAVDKHAKPLYDSVMSAHPVVDVPTSITNRPAVAQAMKDAVSLAKNHGEALVNPTETKTILAGDGYHIADDVASPAKTSLGYWDYVKKAMDSRINGMMKTGGVQDLNSAEKADLSGLMDAKTSLVKHLDNVTDGAYAVARRAAATKFQVGDAVDIGRSALNTKLLPEELAEHMGGMSIPERAGVQLGMRREMQRIIDTAPDDAAAARRMLDTNQNREKISQVFGKSAADSIDRWIGVHDALDTGRSALNTKLLPEELAEKMRTMGAPEKTLLRAGMRREIDRIMDTARNDGASARRLLDTNQNREKIAQVFGQPAADAVDKRIGAETQFQDATNKISANSRTAVRQQLMKDTEAASVTQPPTANIAGLALAGVRRGREYLGDMSLDRTRQGIADLLTRQGADAHSLAKILSGYNTARAANAAAPMGQQAGGLARVIAAQAPGWFNQLPDNRNRRQPQ